MKVYAIKIDPKNPDKEMIASAARIIEKGGLVAFPTETVYGIAASLFKRDAVAKLYKIKKRPDTKPFTVHIADIKMIETMGCRISEKAKALMDKFWPGPLTIILKSGGGKGIGFRMPANAVALELIRSAGVPVIAPSANISGRPAPVSADDVQGELDKEIDMILDSGKTEIGMESTVIDLTVDPPKILREGAIPAEEIFKVL